ncbi:MAG: hypothetical protein ACI9UK_001087 [Candidatus Krumholzibacteriia bacterium]|jgi:hypothetical protein
MKITNMIAGRQMALTALVLLLTIVTLSPVSDAAAQGEPFMELLRKDIQADKIAMMTVALGLTEAEGEIFWPIYRDHNNELSKIGDGRLMLIKDYAANYETMTEEKAKELAKTSFSLREDKLKLLKSTHKKVSKEVGSIVAARFAQIENQLLMLIDLQIASEMPLVK